MSENKVGLLNSPYGEVNYRTLTDMKNCFQEPTYTMSILKAITPFMCLILIFPECQDSRLIILLEVSLLLSAAV